MSKKGKQRQGKRPKLGPHRPPTLVHTIVAPSNLTDGSAVGASLERPLVSVRSQLTFAPDFPASDPRAAFSQRPNGSLGLYEVQFILAYPGEAAYRENVNVPTLLEEGRSIIAIPTQSPTQQKLVLVNEVEIVNGTKIAVRFVSNENGMLAQAQVRIEAADFVDAERIAHDLIMPQLSALSFHLDVGIDVAACVIREAQSDSRKVVVGLLGRIKEFSPPPFSSLPEFQLLFSSYREGMNATNIFYQFLCFYRIVEGIGQMRKRQSKRVEYLGMVIPPPANELFPLNLPPANTNGDPSEDFFGPYLGKQFVEVIVELQGVIRDVVAHGIMPSQEEDGSLVADRFEDVRRCRLAFPVIRHIARTMMVNEMRKDGLLE